ncbi:MAG TPA: hypothetical protein EYP59_14025, partial [Thiotrichaceae bacterium]|nr:hypothetical protein [Thiotrichaceae bacterium]
MESGRISKKRVIKINFEGPIGVQNSFYLILIQHFGIGFSLNYCVKCRSENNLQSLSPKAGGILCKNCSIGQYDAMIIDINTMREIKKN